MTHRIPQTIVDDIKSWNRRDVYELRDLIAELWTCRDTHGRLIDLTAYGLNIADLPSAPIPDWVRSTDYPVWAVDKNGYALVGPELLEVLHIECLPSERNLAGWAIWYPNLTIFGMGETLDAARQEASRVLFDKMNEALENGTLEALPVTRAVLRRWQTEPRNNFPVFRRGGIGYTQHQLDYYDSSGSSRISQRLPHWAHSGPRISGPTMTPDEIREARKRLNLSPSELAAVMGLPGPMLVSEWEHGVRTPSIQSIRLIQAYLDGYRPTDWPN